MPDWSYRTVFRPLLFQVPPVIARDVCLGVLGTLGRSPIGPFVIDFLGHMGPDRRLAQSVQGISFRAPIGLGSGIDAEACAVAAFARFGFGFIEVGPATVRPRHPRDGGSRIERRVDDQAIVAPTVPWNAGAKALAARLKNQRSTTVSLVARLVVTPGAETHEGADQIREMAAEFAPHVAILAIEAGPDSDSWNAGSWTEFLDLTARGARDVAPRCGLWIVIASDADSVDAERRVRAAQYAGFQGALIDGRVEDRARPGWKVLGRPARAASLAMVRALRTGFGGGLAIAASGGVHEPADALDLLDSGADLVLIDSGLVYSGPGLPKRVNDAVLFASEGPTPLDTANPQPAPRPPELSWFWLWLLGIGMLIGGALALLIAATRVVLPYDEHFVAMTRETLETLNARLIPFMTHDRATLAGTMVTIGVLYCALAWFGVRQGLHWALIAIEVSAFSGFASFFLFLGFGYFDPFHAFVTLVLLQLLFFGIHSRLSPPAPQPSPDLHETSRWRLSLWGQLMFIAQAVGFIAGGLTICYVGITTVFVPEDLMFLDSTAHELSLLNPRLLSLVAHDRASFGGMLVASGLVFLMASLWGFRRGRRWLWWTILVAGAAGFAPAIIVHFAVGYENVWHLTPAFLGLGVFITGLALSYSYLCRPDAQLNQEWARRRTIGRALPVTIDATVART
jgi:hypothetical protein